MSDSQYSLLLLASLKLQISIYYKSDWMHPTLWPICFVMPPQLRKPDFKVCSLF